MTNVVRFWTFLVLTLVNQPDKLKVNFLVLINWLKLVIFNKLRINHDLLTFYLLHKWNICKISTLSCFLLPRHSKKDRLETSISTPKTGKVYWSIYLMLGIEGVFRTQSNIYDEAFGKNSERLRTVNYFCKNHHQRCLTGYIWNLRLH